MYSLTRAGFARLFKCKGFYAAMIFSAASASLCLSGSGMYWGSGHEPVCDFYLCNWLSLFPFAAAILTCFFCADEYRGGALRSKIVVGHTKAKIYFSNLIVCSAGALMVFAAGIAFCAVLAALSGMIWITSPTETVYAVAVSAVTVIGSTAFALIFSMLISRPAAAVAAVLVITTGISFLSYNVSERLDFPEYRISASGIDHELFDSVLSEAESYEEELKIAEEHGWLKKNPYYVGGIKRVMAYSAYLAPSSQAAVLYSAIDDSIYLGEPVLPVLKAPLPCALFSILLTAFGAFLFNRKNIN